MLGAVGLRAGQTRLPQQPYVVGASRERQTQRLGDLELHGWPTFYANTHDVDQAGGAGWRLFTQAQSSTLANLPGEVD